MFNELISLICGILFGTLTGLIPGIHINLIGTLLISFSTTIFSDINPIYLIIFITSLAITHTFLDFIPSIFLGCPDTDTELSILPGHELLKKGQGYEAIMLTAYGSIVSILLLTILLIPAIILRRFIYSKYLLLKPLIPGLLLLAVLLIISFERYKLKAVFVLILTGILGLCVLNISPTILKEPLLPLLAGLFGSSTLIISIKNKTTIPFQELKKPKIKSLKPFLGAFIAAPLCGFLPGLGSGQAALIGNAISKTNKQEFLTLIGATNTLVMGISFISLYLIFKTRTGAAATIKNILGAISTNNLILIIIVIIITGLICFFLTDKIAKFISTRISKINYFKISIITLIVLSIITTLISGLFGFLILIVSTLTGIYCISLKVRRTNMMGCLIIPTIIWYLTKNI